MVKPRTILALVLAFGFATTSGAETFVVNKLSDGNGACTADDCALREAIIAANATPGADTILLPAGRHLLSIPGIGEGAGLEGDLDIRGPVTIEGAVSGQTIVDGGGVDRVFEIFSQTGQVFFRRVVITGGEDGVLNQTGGAIYCIATDLVIEDSEITGNHAFEAGGLDLVVSTVRIERTLIANNSADLRGGGFRVVGIISNYSDVQLINSTVTGNVAGMGGGVSMVAEARLEVINSTVAGNDAYPGSAFDQEFTDTAALSFRNSIIEGGCGYAQAGINASLGGNLESPGDTCRLVHPSDQVAVEKLGLAELDWNGGRTRSRALLFGSPAVDAGTSSCEAADQRGQARPQDGDGDGVATCDAGAFELAGGPAVEVPLLSPLALGAFAALLALGALRRLWV